MKCFLIIFIAIIVIILINNTNCYNNKLESFNIEDPIKAAKIEVDNLKTEVELSQNKYNLTLQNIEKKKKEISNCLNSV